MRAVAYVHVRIQLKGDRQSWDDLLLLDQSMDWVRERIIDPRDAGEPITVKGRTLGWSEIKAIKIAETDEPAEVVAGRLEAHERAESERTGIVVVGASARWEVVDAGRDLTDEVISGPPGGRAGRASLSTGNDPERQRKVMVVHGRDATVTKGLFEFLRALDLRPLEWTTLISTTGVGSPYTGEVLDSALEVVQAVVVLFTPDDQATLRADLTQEGDVREEGSWAWQPRPNVLFEAGLAFGRHPERTILVEHGRLRGLSDLTGRHTVRLSHEIGPLQDLAQRLKTAGCSVDTSGRDWLVTSRFPAPQDPPSASSPTEPSNEALERLLVEILRVTETQEPAEDLVRELASRVKRLEGPSMGEALLEGLPGRNLSVRTQKRLTNELLQHGVLARNPNGRGFVRGDLPR